jgi:hypothetical protein
LQSPPRSNRLRRTTRAKESYRPINDRRWRIVGCVSAHQPDHTHDPVYLGSAARAGRRMGLGLLLGSGRETTFNQIDNLGK